MKTRLCVVTTLALLASLISIAPASAQQINRPRLSARSINEAPDFATEAFTNGWDFTEASDLPNIDGLNTIGFSNVRVEGGKWKATGEPLANLRLLQSWDSIPIGRDGALFPIDADRFTHISFRMRLTGQTQAAGEVTWYDCGKTVVECKGGVGFLATEGWRTYNIALENDPAKGPVEWNGDIRGLILLPSAKAADIEIDWIRLYEPTTSGIRVKSKDSRRDAQLIWDRDKDPTNNTTDNGNWGVVGTIGRGALRFQTDGYPAGTYFLYTESPAGRSVPRKIKINDKPVPAVIQPDAIGGASYDTVVRGDAWDYSSASDVGLARNMTWSIQDGQLVGVNASPVLSDSGFRLPIVEGQPIDADKYHRFTARVFFEGGFSLSAAPGGGMNARLIWRTTNGDVRITEDIVVSPGWNTISIDLNDFTSNELLEEDDPLAWAGQDIELFRFDPHEDSGSRRFFVDWIKLAEDDKPTDGRYTVEFRDRTWDRGSSAEIWISRNSDGTGGQQVGSMASINGKKNRFPWTVPANLVGTGEWYVVVKVTDPKGNTGSNVSRGSLTL
jgi:hypothetical protein